MSTTILQPVTHWQQVELDLLSILALHLPVLTVDQVARGWFSGNRSAAEQSLTALHRAGLVESLDALVHPLLYDLAPVHTWEPGDPDLATADCQKIAYYLNHRWTQDDYLERFYVASQTAHFMSGTRTVMEPRHEQWTHDYHVSEIYIRLRVSEPEQANHWLGEGALPKLGHGIRFMKDPDAFLVDEHRCSYFVFDFAGRYDEKHIQDLHNHCAGGAHKKERSAFPQKKHLLYPNPEGTSYALY